MIILNRNINTTATIKTAENNPNAYFSYCQASLNSDGKITLRNYDKSNKNKDEIIILSDTETNAIFELMCKINENTKNRGLPF